MPETPPVDDLVTCPYCGRKTSSSANFCYYCARELKARPEHPAEEPKPLKINWIVVGIIAAVILFLLAYSVLH